MSASKLTVIGLHSCLDIDPFFLIAQFWHFIGYLFFMIVILLVLEVSLSFVHRLIFVFSLFQKTSKFIASFLMNLFTVSFHYTFFHSFI